MAGGMRSGRGGLPMSERVARARARQAEDACPVRHCWVSGAVDDAGVKRPGLLVEWRRGGAGWEGRVVYPAALRAGVGWVLVEEWLPADLLTPR